MIWSLYSITVAQLKSDVRSCVAIALRKSQEYFIYFTSVGHLHFFCNSLCPLLMPVDHASLVVRIFHVNSLSDLQHETSISTDLSMQLELTNWLQVKLCYRQKLSIGFPFFKLEVWLFRSFTNSHFVLTCLQYSLVFLAIVVLGKQGSTVGSYVLQGLWGWWLCLVRFYNTFSSELWNSDQHIWLGLENLLVMYCFSISSVVFWNLECDTYVFVMAHYVVKAYIFWKAGW